MEIRIVREPIPLDDIRTMAQATFGDMVKAVVDVRRNILAVGGELHADAEQTLLNDGSAQADLWGINFYPDESADQFIEFTSLINIRPVQGNRSLGVEDEAVRERIQKVVSSLIQRL